MTSLFPRTNVNVEVGLLGGILKYQALCHLRVGKIP